MVPDTGILGPTINIDACYTHNKVNIIPTMSYPQFGTPTPVTFHEFQTQNSTKDGMDKQFYMEDDLTRGGEAGVRLLDSRVHNCVHNCLLPLDNPPANYWAAAS